MTQGIYIKSGTERPKFMKDAIAAIKEDPSKVYLEATSLFGNEYDGPVSEMPLNQTVYIVGPDPQRRNWFMNLTREKEGFRFNK